MGILTVLFAVSATSSSGFAMKQVNNRSHTPKKAQSGVVLVIGLIFLLVLTIVGMTSIQNSSMQERMAGNASDRNAVFQAAEIAVQRGEAFVDNASCSMINGALAASPPNPDDVDNWSGDTAITDTTPNGSYIVYRMPAIVTANDASDPYADPDVCGGFYYVTAAAISDKGMAVVLQSAVVKRF